ncbi:MAG: hypothetical protein EOO42_01255 [Flavobacteriales bacterium]|nr:MAG: hypothetical protein EOO42_01255 [Flavobacteriales bacterium]
MAVEKYTVSGIEKLRIGPGQTTGVIPSTGMLDISDYITPGSVIYTKNVDSIERIIPDGKSVAYVTFLTPGDPNTIVIGLLDQNPAVEALVGNIVYDAATTTVTELAQRVIRNICIEITTFVQNGKRCIIIIPNVDVTLGTADPLTFNNVEKFVINGELKAFTASTGQDAIRIKKFVNPDGTAINSIAPTVSAGANSTANTNPKVLTGTATPQSPKTIVSTVWSQVSGPSTAVMATPNALSNSVSGLVSGVYVFKLTATDSVGVVSESFTQVTATI